MFLHVFLIELVACFTAEDDELTDDVLSAEVDTWVGLREAFLLCHPDGLRERYVGRNLVEDIVEGSTEHSLEFLDFVARVDEVVHRVDDGKSGTHVGLVHVFHTSVACRCLESLVNGIVGRCCHLVGRHDVDAVVEEVLVETSDSRCCCAVDEYGVEDVHSDDLFPYGVFVSARMLSQLLSEVLEVDSVAVVNGSGDVDDAYDVEFEAAFLHEDLALLLDLLNE